MKQVKYNVCDDEGTLIGVVWAAPMHVGGDKDAIEEVASMYGIEKIYLRARVADNQSPSKHTTRRQDLYGSF